MEDFLFFLLFLGICIGVAIAIIPSQRKKYLQHPKPHHYEAAEREVKSGTTEPGIWAKALVTAKGNEDLRKSEYIKLRAKQLQEEN